MNKRELELQSAETLSRIEQKLDILLELSGIEVIEDSMLEELSTEK